jgi:hypothetical protein
MVSVLRQRLTVCSWPIPVLRVAILSVSIWTPPRLQVTCQWQLARLHTYIRPLSWHTLMPGHNGFFAHRFHAGP